jgi:hypothetical protein
MAVKRLGSGAAACVLVLGLGACGTAPFPRHPDSASEGGAGSLTDADLAAAMAAARREIAEESATVTSATVTTRSGTLQESNTGFSCESGRILDLKLIGTFLHITAAPVPLDANRSATPEDFDVHAVLLAVDAASGQTCQIGVQTGQVHPATGAVVLDVG